MAGELTAEQIEAAVASGATDTELSWIERLKAKGAEFQAAYEALLSWEPAVVDTELEPEWERLVERGETLRTQIGAATAGIDSALRWVRGVFGLEGLRGGMHGQLGAVWYIPVAAIAAAVAAITWWLADYAKFAKKFAEQQRIAAELRAQGVDPIEAERQAAATVAAAIPGWLAPLKGPLGWIALAAGGYAIWRISR